jgi:hypothetical protein
MPKTVITQILSPTSVRIDPPWTHGGKKGDRVGFKAVAAPNITGLPEVGEPGYAWRKQLAESCLSSHRAHTMVGENVYYEGESVDTDGQLIANVWVHVSGILIPENWTR